MATLAAMMITTIVGMITTTTMTMMIIMMEEEEERKTINIVTMTTNRYRGDDMETMRTMTKEEEE